MSALVSWPVVRATARERGLAPYTLILAAMIILSGLWLGVPASWGTEPFTGVSSLWFSLLVLFLGAGLLSDEIESGHAQLVLLRPLTRAQWVGGRFVGAALILCGAGVAGWAAAVVAAFVRGGSGDFLPRIASLPLVLAPAVGWLATLVAIGAVARGWTNAGLLFIARVGWQMLHFSLPLALPRWPSLRPLLDAIDTFYGPQDALPIARQLHYGERFTPGPLLWDVFWIFLAWLVAVRLFNLRELARRRA